jgi:hypothetical protein
MLIGSIPLVLVLAGCGADAPTAVTSRVPDASANRAAIGLSISGHCETTPLTPPVVTFPILRQEDTGSCQFSRLGRATVHASRVVNLVTGTQVADITFTAANGDILRTTAVGAISSSGPTSFRFTGTNTIVGGTGRFTSATGELQAIGVVDLATSNASTSYEGWISYEASDRAN